MRQQSCLVRYDWFQVCSLLLLFCWAHRRFFYQFSDGLGIWPCLYQLSISEFCCRGTSWLLEQTLLFFLRAELTGGLTLLSLGQLRPDWHIWWMNNFLTHLSDLVSLLLLCQVTQANCLIQINVLVDDPPYGNYGEVPHLGRECGRVA